MPLVKVCTVDDVKEGQSKVVSANGNDIALFKQDGQFFAIDNTCPHRGGPLGEGMVENGVVTCPWHGWRFDIATGVSPVMPSAKVGCYKVTVSGDDVMVEV